MNSFGQRPAIDLTRYHFAIPYKDLMIFGSWVWSQEQEDEEPCLVILPRYRREGFTPVCVALSAAYRYNQPKYLAQASRIFNKSLGFEDSMANSHKVADAIFNHLLDLLKMPVSPTQTIVVGEATIDTGSGAKRTVELLDHQPLAQA